ncbi:MAG: hypothetical protein EZS28_048744, partial [Streblomastix strix]
VDHEYQGGCSEIAFEYVIKLEQFRWRVYFWKFESVWQSETIDVQNGSSSSSVITIWKEQAKKI